jgi:hypothetical protein
MSIGLLEERRTVLRMKLEHLILRGVSYAICYNGRGECDFPSRCARAYIQLLQSAELWPIATVTMSISKAIDVLEKMGDPTVSFDGIQCDCLSMHSTPNYKRNRNKDLDELKNSVGLCLDCVFSGCTTATAYCSIKH